MLVSALFFFFFFNDTATTEIYTLSLHDALPICARFDRRRAGFAVGENQQSVVRRSVAIHADRVERAPRDVIDRKSTRLNSSHVRISYAVFCLKKKKQNQ